MSWHAAINSDRYNLNLQTVVIILELDKNYEILTDKSCQTNLYPHIGSITRSSPLASETLRTQKSHRHINHTTTFWTAIPVHRKPAAEHGRQVTQRFIHPFWVSLEFQTTEEITAYLRANKELVQSCICLWPWNYLLPLSDDTGRPEEKPVATRGRACTALVKRNRLQSPTNVFYRHT